MKLNRNVIFHNSNMEKTYGLIETLHKTQIVQFANLRKIFIQFLKIVKSKF